MHPPRYPALWCPHPGGFVGEFWRKVPSGKVRSTMHRIYGNMKILIDTVIWKYMNIRSGLLIVYIYIVLILHQCKNKSCKNISQEKSRIGWPGPQSIPFHTASATYQNHLPPQGGRAGHGARLPRHHARVSVSFQLFSYKFNPQDSNQTQSPTTILPESCSKLQACATESFDCPLTAGLLPSHSLQVVFQPRMLLPSPMMAPWYWWCYPLSPAANHVMAKLPQRALQNRKEFLKNAKGFSVSPNLGPFFWGSFVSAVTWGWEQKANISTKLTGTHPQL